MRRRAGALRAFLLVVLIASSIACSKSLLVTDLLTSPPDTTPPLISTFNIPATTRSLTLSVALSATDNVGVTAYLLSESASQPTPDAKGWNDSPPISYTFDGFAEGVPTPKTLYAWAKDAAGNVSSGLAADVVVTLPSIFYVDPNAPDDSGTGTISSPKKFITSGVALLSGGDTLILKDGVYTGQKNILGDHASPQIYPPSGSEESFTTIRAEHVGQAIVDGEYNYNPFAMGNGPTYRNYLHIDGIHFRYGAGTVFEIAGNHNWVSNCGFEDGLPYTNDNERSIASVSGGSSYVLVEDTWIWGKGRYGLYTGSTNGGTHHIIFRRVVVRIDAAPAGWMSAGLRFYNSNTNAMQNCIVIDSLIGSNSAANGTCTECWSFAQGGGSSAGEWGHVFDGNIALNNPDRGGFSNEKGYLPSTETWKNSVFWGLKSGFFPYNLAPNNGYGTSGQNVWTVSNMLVGNSGAGIALTSNRLYEAYNITDSIFTGNVASAFGASAKVLTRTLDHVIAYNNGSNACPLEDGCTVLDLDTTTDPLAQIVQHLPRVESGNVGPSILYQVGGTGLFHGDAGWDATGSTPLWPYPNEQTWSAKMQAYSVNTVSGNRGFAALSGTTSTPLTDYIWGYLGKPKPGIYENQ